LDIFQLIAGWKMKSWLLSVYLHIGKDMQFCRITWCDRLSAVTSPRLLRALSINYGAERTTGTSTELRQTRNRRAAHPGR